MGFLRLGFLLAGLCVSASGQSTPTASTPVSAVQLSLTTQFAVPTQCTRDSLSEVPGTPGVLFNNVVASDVAGSWSTCLPSAFYSSILAVESGAALPAFSALVCPDTWESWELNATYVVCCPPAFAPYGVDMNNTQRPAATAVCTSLIWPSVLMDVTSYDATGGSTILPTTAPTDGAMAFAWAYDGITATPINQTTTTISTSQSTSTSTPVSSAPSAASSAPSVLGFESLGCFDSEGTRASNEVFQLGFTLGQYTVEACAATCQKYGPFLGLVKSDCYCGNTLMEGTRPVPASQCSFPCSGNAQESCGDKTGRFYNIWSQGGVPPVYIPCDPNFNDCDPA